MSKYYSPNESHSLDNSMVLWRGRLIFRQYIKNKRHKYRVKPYGLIESTDIILRTSICSSVSCPDPHDLGQTDALVMCPLTDFIGKGYTVYADKYYYSVRLT